MKAVLPWIRSNLLVVIVMGLTVLVLPAALVVSSMWNASIKKQYEDDVSGVVKKLDSLRVTYSLPAAGDQPAVSLASAEPNDVANNAYVARLKELSARGEKVKQAAEARNKANKTPMVDGLFPAPADDSARVRLLSALGDTRKAAQLKLLKDANAGDAVAGSELLMQLHSFRDEEVRTLTHSRENQKLSAEEENDIQHKLAERRVALLQARASQLRFFADPGVFTRVRPGESSGGMPGMGNPGGGAGYSGSPMNNGGSPSMGVLPTMDQAWDWQMELWVDQDIVQAIEKANTGPNGNPLTVIDAPIKRLLVLAVHEAGDDAPGRPGGNTPGGVGAPSANGNSSGNAPVSAGGGENAEVPRDYKLSYSGRPAHNGLYDVKVADVVMICDSSRLPVIINAFNTTNFSIVSHLDFKAIADTARDEREGYYYGDGHLVAATFQVETAWLRSWTLPLMPAEVKTKLGVGEPATATPAGGGEAGGKPPHPPSKPGKK